MNWTDQMKRGPDCESECIKPSKESWQAKGWVGKPHICEEASRCLTLRFPPNHSDLDLALWPYERSVGTRRPLNSSFRSYHSRYLSRRLHKTFGFEISFQGIAMGALQEAMEAYLMGLFEDTNLCTVHAKQATILPWDMQLVHRI